MNGLRFKWLTLLFIFLLVGCPWAQRGFAGVCLNTAASTRATPDRASPLPAESLMLAKASGAKKKTDRAPAPNAPPTNHPPRITSVYPDEPTLSDIRVGTSILFVISASDPDPYAYLNYEWYVDGASKSTDASFMYALENKDIGTHTIQVKVSDGSLTTSHQWSVIVRNFNIEVAAAEHGTLSPSPQESGSISVAPGSEAVFTIKPDECYRVEEVLVDGNPVGAVGTYRFDDVKDDHAIAAKFAPLTTYTISAGVREHGNISPSGALEVNCRADMTFTITAHSHYETGEVLVDGIPVGPVSSYTFGSVIADHTLTATFIKVSVIEVSSGEHGTVSPSGRVSVKDLSDRTFTIVPDLGFLTSEVRVDGNSVGAVEKYVFQNVSEDHTLSALFVPNEPPVADAGPDQTAKSGTTVLLSGSNSTDPDDGISSYSWEQTGGPAVTLSNPTGVQTTFIAPEAAGPLALTFQLTATDHGGMQSIDSCTVNLVKNNFPPVARAGFAQNVGEGETAILDGSGSYDFNGGITSYHWEQLDGPTVTLSDHGVPQPGFSAKDLGHEGASLMFKLTVTDRVGLKSSDFCLVNVTSENDPPTAVVGPDQNVIEGATVQLDGSKSYDSDNGGILSYRWKQVAGPPVTLADPNASHTTFAALRSVAQDQSLTFLFIVTDAGNLRASTPTTVFISPPLTLTSPNGGEVWHAGETHTIAWNFTENTGLRPEVSLELLKGDSLVTVLASGIPMGTRGNGSYNWTIPSSMTAGNDYRISVLGKKDGTEGGVEADRNDDANSGASTEKGRSSPETGKAGGPDSLVYKDTSYNPFTITEAAPVPDFSASPLRGAAPLEVHFTDSSTGAVTQWLWDFGDGATSEERNPVHTYEASGVYPVALEAAGPGGARTEVKADLIHAGDQSPVAGFNVSARSGPVGLKVSFKDESEGIVTNWSWDFGDGETSEEQNPTHTYVTAGSYDVTLKIEGPKGSDAQTITDCVAVEEAP